MSEQKRRDDQLAKRREKPSETEQTNRARREGGKSCNVWDGNFGRRVSGGLEVGRYCRPSNGTTKTTRSRLRFASRQALFNRCICLFLYFPIIFIVLFVAAFHYLQLQRL